MICNWPYTLHIQLLVELVLDIGMLDSVGGNPE